MDTVGVSRASHTVHDNRADRHLAFIAFAACLALDQGSQKQCGVRICGVRAVIHMALCLLFGFLSGIDLLHGLSGVDQEIKLYKFCGDIAVLSVIINADPARLLVLADHFHDLSLGEQSVNTYAVLRAGLFSDAEALRVNDCDHLTHIVCKGKRLVIKEEILIRRPAHEGSRLDLGPSVLSFQDCSATVLIQLADLGRILRRIAAHIQSILYIRHDERSRLILLLLCSTQVEIQFFRGGTYDLRHVLGTGFKHYRDSPPQLFQIAIGACLNGHIRLQQADKHHSQSQSCSR